MANFRNVDVHTAARAIRIAERAREGDVLSGPIHRVACDGHHGHHGTAHLWLESDDTLGSFCWYSPQFNPYMLAYSETAVAATMALATLWFPIYPQDDNDNGVGDIVEVVA
jgi:hypothetical protein